MHNFCCKIKQNHDVAKLNLMNSFQMSDILKASFYTIKIFYSELILFLGFLFEAIFANHQICMQFILVMTNKSISELLRKLMKQFPVPVDPKSRIPMWKMIISRFLATVATVWSIFRSAEGNILSIWLKSSLDNRNSSCYTCTHTNSVQMMLIYEMSLKIYRLIPTVVAISRSIKIHKSIIESKRPNDDRTVFPLWFHVS